jgi:hypothetical protein
MGFDLSWVVHAEGRRSRKTASGCAHEVMAAIVEWATEIKNGPVARCVTHECIAHRDAPGRDNSERGRASRFHEESAGSGAIAVGGEPG